MRTTIIKALIGLAMLSMSGCYATIGTPGAIKEHFRGVNGGLTISKAKAGESPKLGYWESQLKDIESAWATLTNEEQGS